MTEENADSIAIIGMAIRVPGADSLEEFWDIIQEGREAIHPEQEDEQKEEQNRKHFFHVNTCVNHKKEFDASFFDISAAEAKRMDPQQRCFMECTWEAMENAGYVPKKYDGMIGLYAGAYANTYLMQNVFPSMVDDDFLENMEVLMANEKDHIATRTAYKMNFTGPVVNVQSSCSSSLAAVHLACQGLLDYSCDMAIAGAATIGAQEEGGYYYQDTGLLSKDGHVRPFDNEATGTIYSEGIGVVVLKRLEDAIVDQDHIYALIKGSALNNDGSERMGYTAPSVKGQAKVIRRALLNAEVEPEDISYIETHGTGTPLGDRIELEALHKVFEKSGQTGFCALGSIKANVGHAGPASGVIGLIKTSLALEKQMLPPCINYKNENVAIDIFGSPFYVNTFLQRWETDSGIRRAGVSSFGLGGTNVHVILESSPKRIEEQDTQGWNLFTLSAKSESSLEQMKQEYVKYLKEEKQIPFSDMIFTLLAGRENFPYRYACSCNSSEMLLEQLEKKEWNKKENGLPLALFVTDRLSNPEEIRMHLYEQEFYFKKAYDAVKNIIAQVPEYAKVKAERICVTYALAKMWLDWGAVFYKIEGKGDAAMVALALKEELSLEQMVFRCLGTEEASAKMQSENIEEFFTEDCKYILLGDLEESERKKIKNSLSYTAMNAKEEPLQGVYCLLGRLWSKGYIKSLDKFLEGKRRERVPVPGYEFDRQIYWIEQVAIEKKTEKNIENEQSYYIRTNEQMEGYIEPAGFMEKKLAQIWEKELAVKPVGATDGFFQLGGNSLKAAKVNGIICDYFDIDLSLKDFVQNQTVRELKNYIMTM